MNKQNLIKAMSKMDIDAIGSILDDNLSYNDTTKAIFLEKLNDIFMEFKKQDDCLVAHEGQCCSETCENKTKKGTTFIGNNSGNYISFIIEQDDNSTIKDVYDCNSFCPNTFELDISKRQFWMQIYNDEKVDFVPSPFFIDLDKKVKKALNDLERYNNSEISKEAILNWLHAYKKLFDSFEVYPLFYKYEQVFYNAYFDIKNIADFFALETQALKALQAFKTINSNGEQELLLWLVTHEELYLKLISLPLKIVPEKTLKTGLIKLQKDFNIYFKTYLLKNCIEFEAIYKAYYFDQLNKYDPSSRQQKQIQIFLDDDYMETSSLKYHLEKRGVFY